MSEVTLAYKRDQHAETSSGYIRTSWGNPNLFSELSFEKMICKLSDELRGLLPAMLTPLDVFILRLDREGLVPYKLDPQTVTLIETDPLAAIAALTYSTTSPTTAIKRARERNVPIVPVPIRVGFDVLSDAFGDDVYFRVRGHELECPGCGFWGMFTSPGLLNDPERAGQVFKTAFVCPKKCHTRILVTCWERWGSVSVEYLLTKTKLEVFYLPRPWNEHRTWISREQLQSKFDQYQKEKESEHV